MLIPAGCIVNKGSNLSKQVELKHSVFNIETNAAINIEKLTF